VDVRVRSQRKKDRIGSPLRVGLHYNECGILPGAQTERRGEAGPVRDLAWRLDLTGRFV
jgi:hypothetical protein